MGIVEIYMKIKQYAILKTITSMNLCCLINPYRKCERCHKGVCIDHATEGIRLLAGRMIGSKWWGFCKSCHNSVVGTKDFPGFKKRL